MSLQVAVFHPGTQHSWQTSLALQQLGRLRFYATSIFYQPDRWPYRLERYVPEPVRGRLHGEFRRFSHPALDTSLVRTSGLSEWGERFAFRAGFRGLAKRIDRYGNERFAASLLKQVASSQPFALWGYDNSSRDVFRAAKAHGRQVILDRTNGDWRAFNETMGEVYAQYPEFFLTKNFRVSDARIAHNDEEYALADVILAGSPFAASTVRDNAADHSAADRVRVLNYCYDEMLFGSLPPPAPRQRDEPIRFLFVGQAGVRKGIHLVLKVFERIPASAARLKIVGDLQVPAAVFARFADRVTYLPTVARADMPALMAASDVLLFPSYFEGSALSLIEGLASGLALIQSPFAGCGVTPDTGIMLPELSERALYEAVMTAIESRQQVEQWRANGPAEARNYSFARYCERINALLAEVAT